MAAIRWDNINRTGGNYNAVTNAAAQGSAEINQGFANLQSLLNNQNATNVANRNNEISNNDVAFSQYMNDLQSGGVDAVEAARNNGGIANQIAGYGGMLSKANQVRDGSQILTGARTDANAADTYQQNVYAKTSKPLIAQWNAFNSSNQDAQRDTFLDDNMEALLASGDYSRLKDKGITRDRTEYVQGEEDAQIRLGKSADALFFDGIGDVQAQYDALDPMGTAIASSVLNEDGTPNINATRQQIKDAQTAQEKLYDNIPSDRDTLDDHKKKLMNIPGMTREVFQASMSNFKASMEDMKYTPTVGEEREWAGIEAGIDQQYGTLLQDQWRQDELGEMDPAGAVSENFNAALAGNEELADQMATNKWWSNNQNKEKAIQYLQKAATVGIKVPANGSSKAYTAIIPSGMTAEIAQYYGDNWGTDDTIEEITQRFIQTEAYQNRLERSEGRKQATTDLTAIKNRSTFAGRGATQVGRAIAQRQSEFFKDEIKVNGIQADNVAAVGQLNAELIARKEAKGKQRPEWLTNLVEGNNTPTEPNPQTLRADGTPKDLFGTFLTNEPSAPQSRAEVEQIFAEQTAMAQEQPALPNQLTSNNNQESALGNLRGLAGNVLNSGVSNTALAGAGLLSNAISKENENVNRQKAAQARVVPDVANGIRNNITRTVNNLMDGAASAKTGVKQLATLAEKALPDMGIGLKERDAVVKRLAPKLKDPSVVSSLTDTEITSLLSSGPDSKIKPYVKQLQAEMAKRRKNEESSTIRSLKDLASGRGM